MIDIKKTSTGTEAAVKARHNYTITKKYPPYGKQLSQLRQSGRVPCVRVIVSTDWHLGKAFPRVVVTGEMPANKIQFNYLAGLAVEIVYKNNQVDLANKLTEEILKVHPRVLVTFNYELAKTTPPHAPAARLIYSEGVRHDI